MKLYKKIIELGDSYAVTISKKIIKKLKLKKGDYISFDIKKVK